MGSYDRDTLNSHWQNAIMHYIRLLRLDQWDIETRVCVLRDPGMSAEVEFFSNHYKAVVSLDIEYTPEHQDAHRLTQTLDELAAHEVLHILVVNASGWKEDGGLPEPMRGEELVISALSRLLATLSPSWMNLKEAK